MSQRSCSRTFMADICRVTRLAKPAVKGVTGDAVAMLGEGDAVASDVGEAVAAAASATAGLGAVLCTAGAGVTSGKGCAAAAGALQR